MLNVLIRVSASNSIGLGNLTRCLELAKCYLEFGHVTFWSDDEIVKKYATERGIQTYKVNQDLHNFNFDLLLIDSKESLSEVDCLLFRQFARRIVFLENVSAAALKADMIIFPNAHYTKQSVFGDVDSKKLPRIIEGWKYVIIRDEVKKLRSQRGGGVVVTTGGSDPQNVTGKLLKLLENSKLQVTFLVGKYFQHNISSVKNDNIVLKDFDIYTLAAADLVISTFGVTIYECLYLEKRVISLAHSLENAVGSDIISKCSTVSNLGYFASVTQEAFDHAIMNPPKIPSRLFDGNGSYEIVKSTRDLL